MPLAASEVHSQRTALCQLSSRRARSGPISFKIQTTLRSTTPSRFQFMICFRRRERILNDYRVALFVDLVPALRCCITTQVPVHGVSPAATSRLVPSQTGLTSHKCIPSICICISVTVIETGVVASNDETTDRAANTFTVILERLLFSWLAFRDRKIILRCSGLTCQARAKHDPFLECLPISQTKRSSLGLDLVSRHSHVTAAEAGT